MKTCSVYLEFFQVTHLCTDINMPFIMKNVENISEINFIHLDMCDAAGVSNFPQSCIDDIH